MPAKIFLLDLEGRLSPLEESGYSTEDELQRLLDRNPDLLAGDQIAPDDPVRWLLVSREAAIADGEGGFLRWSLDHLFLDHHGVPTLVEVKRASNPQVRREVVGQLLEYAANAAFTWKPGELRVVVEEGIRATGMEPESVLAEGLGVTDPEEFWMAVDDNLRLGRLRLLFVADRIPLELQRVVEFLNQQMDRTEVLAVEVRQFAGVTHRTLVPRVLGQTTAAKARKSGSRRSKPWTREELLEELSRRHGPSAQATAEHLMDWCGELGLRSTWGRGKHIGSFIPVLDRGTDWYSPFALWTGGEVEIPFGYLKHRPPFIDRTLRGEYAERLSRIQGVEIGRERLDGAPSFQITLLVSCPESSCHYGEVGVVFRHGKTSEAAEGVE